VVDPNWATAAYSPACSSSAFDSYVRALDWAPDSSYFVIAATGGPHAGTLCDTAARWDVADTGTAVTPRWVDATGGDTLCSVAVTTAAVYVGGHERWLNNPLGSDHAAPGAVPRPGMAALDPLNGVPMTWNPGRNPRGIGAEAMLATANGLYVGSDTDWIGNFKYKRQKIAYFPLAGGTAPASQDTGTLPADVYLAGRPSNVAGGVDAVLDRYYTGTTASPDKTAPTGGVAWSQARGAFMVGSTLYYGFPDPANANSYELVKRTFDGSTYGPAQFVTTPYLDPAWDGVSTGSPPPPATPIPYDGMFPNFYGQQLSQVTGMFYAGGRLYYVRNAGTNNSANRAISATLYSRGFSTDSSIVSGDVATVASSGFSDAGGMFVSGGFLYFANRNNGDLRRIAFVNGAPSGSATVVSGPTTDGKDWRTMAMFIGPPPPAANQPPTASFTASCPSLTCSFDASGSSDPNGDPLTYAWTFGDGGTGTGKTPSHTYAAAGSDSVTLTVNDGRGGTNSTTQSVNPVQPTSSIAFRGAAPVAHTITGTTISVTVPPAVQAGDGLVLVLSTNSSATGTADTGFTPVQNGTAVASMTTQLFQKVATASDAGSNVTVTLSAAAHATLTLVAYSGTSAAGPVRSAVSKTTDAGAATSHTTPTATVNPGDWALSAWTDKSSTARTWTAPGDVTQRGETDGAAGGDVSSLVADSNGPISTATYGGETATTSTGSTRTIEFTVVLAGS
jgi:PKD repeat protein